ncbi:MAG: sensor histidine kinase N-terminal domain-containing protein [Zoogloeaceae bacterium]|jgi:two-component system sensor histidine kinase QseC|nr:sensor histidine kinase N-terminal domain-containing protein [Zoogloeaceae bacterium]
MSLSRRLMAILIGASLLYWALVVTIMIGDSARDTYESFDAHLVQTATALLRVTSPEGNSPLPAYDATDPAHAAHDDYETGFRYQIWNRDGTLLLRSLNAPAAALTEHDGFSEIKDGNGKDWRLYSLWNPQGTVRVVVAEAVDRRARLPHGIALNLVKPMALGLPVLLFLLWYSIQRGLLPLRALAKEISRRHAASLTPVDLGATPDEIRPMVLALNDLLKRVEHAVENERCFTANAAHELRTPLAAIQAHLAAARSAGNPEEREHSLNMLQRGLSRSIRLVGQLLTLARLDPEQVAPDTERVDIGNLLESTCAELAPLALRRNQTITLSVDPNLPEARGNPDMLAMLFTNLIDNAIRYTDDGGHVSIGACRHGAAEIRVDVTDDGPGIPAAERERVFERFSRLVDQSKPGTGLGLAICQRVIDLHNGKITLADGPDGKGLSVLVDFPAAKREAG